MGGKIRTIALKTTLQIALRKCYKEAGDKVSIYVTLVKGEYMQSNTEFLQNVAASLVKVIASPVTVKD